MKPFLRLGGCALGLVAGLGLAGACGDSEAITPAPSGTGGSAEGGGGSKADGGGGHGTGGNGGDGTGGEGGHAPKPGVHIDGLTAPVTAIYDASGGLHLAGKTDDDCFATLGYFHAQNRFFFMDFIRNYVRGSLGALVKAGDTVLSKDYVNRQFFATREGKPLEDALYDQASPEVKGHLDAYTKGVNAWIADMRAGKNGATLTTEYDFALIVKAAIRDWEPQDSAAVGLYVLQDLSDNSPDEIALGAQVPAFDANIAADVFAPIPVFDAFTMVAGDTPHPSPPPLSQSLLARLAPHAALLADAKDKLALVAGMPQAQRSGDTGSNNWAVSGSRSQTGRPLLANDPHLLLSNPSIWFPAEIDAKSDGGTGTYHIAGGTFPGLPAVMIGHNEKVGWGVTTAYWDLADVYVEKLSTDNKKVLFNGAEEPLTEKTFTFQDVSNPTMPQTKTFQWAPHHGPLVSVDTAAHTAVSVRWRGHDGGTDLDAFYAMGRAGSVDEAKTGLAMYASSANQNFVVVDQAGDVGWFPYSKVPARPWASLTTPPWLPLPGDDGSAEWGDPVPMADLPQLKNPAAGYVATANNEMTGASADGDPTNAPTQAAIQAWSKADGAREQRILDLLAAGGTTHTVDTMRQIQGDTMSLYGTIVVPEFVAAANGETLTAAQQGVLAAMSAWAAPQGGKEFTCPTGLATSDPTSAKSTDAVETTESIGCTAFHVALFSLVDAAIGDEAKAAGITDKSGFGVEFVVRALNKPTSVASGDLFWDDVSTTPAVETKKDIMLAALTRAGAVLASLGAPDEWRWGRVHLLSLQSIFASFGVPTYNEGPYAAPGGLFTVNVGNPATRSMVGVTKPDMTFTNGPSIRLQMEAVAGGPPTMRYELPGGADLHRESPFYNNLMPNWLANTAVDFPFGKGAVTAPAKTVTVTPP